MMRIFYILSMIFMFSCYSLLSDFEEIDELLSYTYYINEGWDAFESVNLSDTLLASQHSEYYELSLAMFDISIQAIDFEFTNQNFLGPKYKSYNGKAWSQLYYAGEFLNPENSHIRDSLRQQSKIYFDLALNDLDSSLFDEIFDQDWCDTYMGLFYIHYNLGLEQSLSLDSSLYFSSKLLNLKPSYNFNHDELDYRNVHYLRGKIYLQKDMYDEAYDEILYIVEDCNAMVNEEIDINLLLECFDQFANDGE